MSAGHNIQSKLPCSVPGTVAEPNHMGSSRQTTEATMLDSIFWLEKLRHKVPTLCPNSKEILEAMVLTQPIKYSSGLFQDTPYKKNSFGALLHLNTS